MFKSQKPYERYFNWWAKSYERDLKKYKYCVPDKIFEITRDFLPGSDTHTPFYILDIGIGTGLTTLPFKDHNPSLHVTGIDISQNMLQRCQARNSADHLCHVNVTEGALPFIDNHFDLIIMGGVLEYVDDPDSLFSNIARTLKSDGYAVFAYEPFQETLPYQSGFFTGAIEQSPEKLTLRRYMRDGFMPCFYKKYLHATDYIKARCAAHNLNLEKLNSFNAYQWTDKKVIAYDLLLLKKQP